MFDPRFVEYRCPTHYKFDVQAVAALQLDPRNLTFAAKDRDSDPTFVANDHRRARSGVRGKYLLTEVDEFRALHPSEDRTMKAVADQRRDLKPQLVTRCAVEIDLDFVSYPTRPTAEPQPNDERSRHCNNRDDRRDRERRAVGIGERKPSFNYQSADDRNAETTQEAPSEPTRNHKLPGTVVFVKAVRAIQKSVRVKQRRNFLAIVNIDGLNDLGCYCIDLGLAAAMSNAYPAFTGARFDCKVERACECPRAACNNS